MGFSKWQGSVGCDNVFEFDLPICHFTHSIDTTHQNLKIELLLVS